MSGIFENKSILLIGGTGSLGKNLINKIAYGSEGKCSSLKIMSRDEDKQFHLRNFIRNSEDSKLQNLSPLFIVGDIRDSKSIRSAIDNVDIVMNLSALKHVPPYEYFPMEAIKTNTLGVQNLIDEIILYGSDIEKMLQISTDKAVKPVNVYGMTKSLAERITISGNLSDSNTKFFCVRYGNVLESRGSVIPFFKESIKKDLPLTLTHPEMTRFMMTLDQSCELIFRALKHNLPGTILIPKLPSSRVIDIIDVLKENYNKEHLKVNIIGIRPGEKIHEILISEEEVSRTKILNNDYLVIPSLRKDHFGDNIDKILRYNYDNLIKAELNSEYSSKDLVLSKDELSKKLKELRVI
jgi:UDP-glucose 4-epimerase